MTASASGRERYDAGRRGDPPPAPPPLAVPTVDSHCHLDLMDDDVAAAMAAARSVGIERVVTIGIDVPSSEWSVRAAQQHPDVFAAVAIHPNEAHFADDCAARLQHVVARHAGGARELALVGARAQGRQHVSDSGRKGRNAEPGRRRKGDPTA